ncbi:MAG: hypothetical protein LBT74_13530 [Acidobacteriota bacterium]|nr:hypothetical protein [Acidobacteriota bacterium]
MANGGLCRTGAGRRVCRVAAWAGFLDARGCARRRCGGSLTRRWATCCRRGRPAATQAKRAVEKAALHAKVDYTLEEFK